jgi:hypothetical protein
LLGKLSHDGSHGLNGGPFRPFIAVMEKGKKRVNDLTGRHLADFLKGPIKMRAVQ